MRGELRVLQYIHFLITASVSVLCMANKVSHQEVSVISKDTIRFHATFLQEEGEAGDG